VRERFGSWRGAPATVGPPPSLPHVDEPRVVLVDRPGAVQSALFVAQPLPPRSAPGFETRQVMNAVLGGLFTSRLNQNLREEHAYTYGVHSSAIATRTWGGWVATTTVETSVTAAALHELVGELGDVVGEVPRRPFTDAEVERAKAALIQRQAAHLVDARDIAYDFVTTFVEGLPGDYPARYAERIGAVRRDDAARAARDFLTPDRLLVVVVGDRQRVERELRAAWPHVETAHPSLLE
jgi:zinc protease